MREIIFCASAAMVGAGFASGREIMQFFTRYGAFSWALIGLAGLATAWMIRRMLEKGRMGESAGERALLSLFFLTVAGAMTAASGDLWALTVPLPSARGAGRLITLALCLRLAGGSLRGMAGLGRILLFLLPAMLILCLRVKGSGPAAFSFSLGEGALATVGVIGYCGLNGMTAAGVLCGGGGEYGRNKKNGIAACCGLLTAVLLGLGNAALLPHAAFMENAPLPTVSLLRAWGKAGYYLSAAVLYLASATTLIAVLRGLLALAAPRLPRYSKLLVGLAALSVSLLGFSDIVAAAYPVLGWAYLAALFRPDAKKEPAGGC